jgi:hypothetical protein
LGDIDYQETEMNKIEKNKKQLNDRAEGKVKEPPG